MKFEKDHLCSACEQGKIHRKHHKSKTAFSSNKPLYLLHMDFCGSMRIQSINGKRYVLVVFDDYSRYTWVFCLHSKHEASEDVAKLKAKGDIGVFVGYSKESAAFRIYNKQTRKIHESVNVNFDEISKMASKQFSLEPGLTNLNESGKSSNPLVSKVSKASKKNLEDLYQDFYDEYFDSSKIIKSSTTNVETPINEEVFHEAYADHKDFTVFQLDVKTTFLNEILKEEVYVGQPSGFISEQYPDHVYALDKALYGLKQAPQAWIFRYLKGTINLGLWYLKDSGFDLTAYSDADHAGCHLDRKSTSSSVQFLGDKLVCWSSKKQNYVSISSTESEYVAVSSCCA
nr:uncharacterized mitochondrial protein AtMg00810-like [Tanacetum cinerariifolium]